MVDINALTLGFSPQMAQLALLVALFSHFVVRRVLVWRRRRDADGDGVLDDTSTGALIVASDRHDVIAALFALVVSTAFGVLLAQPLIHCWATALVAEFMRDKILAGLATLAKKDAT